MASLTIPNIFTAGTPASASEVNANFTAVVNWSTGLDQDNMATFTGDLAFTIANGNAIVIQNNGNDESIKITQGALLGAGKASILITDSQTQTAANAAELKMVLAAGATIPAIHVTHGVDTFKLTKDSLNLFNDSTKVSSDRIKLPVKTTAQRNAIVSPEEGSVIYNSTTQAVEIKNSTQWQGIGNPIGSMIMFAGSVAPFGWLLCQGQEVSQATYSDLYSIVGSFFNTGGEAIGNFRLPDMRRRAAVGAGGTGSATLGSAVGNSGGAETVTLTTANLPSSATTVSAGNHQHNLTYYQSGINNNFSYISTGASTTVVQNTNLISAAGAHTHTISGATDTPVNIVQPSLVVNYIIKY
jgi:microcystin-dependent protein